MKLRGEIENALGSVGARSSNRESRGKTERRHRALAYRKGVVGLTPLGGFQGEWGEIGGTDRGEVLLRDQVPPKFVTGAN